MSELDCGFIGKLKIWIEKIKCVVQPSQEEIPVRHLGHGTYANILNVKVNHCYKCTMYCVL